MSRAIERINTAIESSETILVHGDYDADGMSATALVTLGLQRVGADPVSFVPHRTRDGYDFGTSGIERAQDVGASLVITVDCGIRALEAVSRASSLGIDVIVTDHHRVGPALPAAVAVVNPMRADSEYPFSELAGVGVAFKLVSALFTNRGIPPAELNQHLDLVSIGTVADQMPLRDENRSLVRAGGRVLARTRKPGLRALMARADVAVDSEVKAEDIAFRVAPRLNSAGRIAEPDTGLQLLLSQGMGEAQALADSLEDFNSERRSTDRMVTDQVERMLEASFRPEADAVAVAWGDGWHPGVVGIVASRVVERWNRPAVVVAFEDEVGSGSGRSVGGFNLVEALRDCEDLLERYGGHQMAAGFTVLRPNMDSLAQRLRSIDADRFGAEPEDATLAVDLESQLSLVTLELFDDLNHLRPFGAGNEKPVLLTRDVGVDRISTVGKSGEHLRCSLSCGGDTLGAIGFRLGERLGELQNLSRVDVAYHLSADTWKGRRRLQAQVLDFRAAGGE
jgi:single-stranded-DNA-specific exonuclease